MWISRTRYRLLRNAAKPCSARPIVPDEVEDAHEFAVERGMDLAALIAWEEHDLADERPDKRTLMTGRQE